MATESIGRTMHGRTSEREAVEMRFELSSGEDYLTVKPADSVDGRLEGEFHPFSLVELGRALGEMGYVPNPDAPEGDLPDPFGLLAKATAVRLPYVFGPRTRGEDGGSDGGSDGGGDDGSDGGSDGGTGCTVCDAEPAGDGGYVLTNCREIDC